MFQGSQFRDYNQRHVKSLLLTTCLRRQNHLCRQAKGPCLLCQITFVQLNVSLLHCFCVLFNSFAKLYTHFWPFTSTSGGKIILQTLVVVITATSVCKMIFSILQPLVAVITATSVCNYSH